MSDQPSNPGERIAKHLSRAGVASRRDAERMIAEGRVAVNGKVIDSPATNVTPRDRISVDGKPVAAAEPPRIWLYHKPAGLVTSARDEQGRQTVFDTLPADLPRVMPVGRLDLTSEGLLLLTNDGGLKRRLELPATGWLRKYRVRVKGTPDDAALEPLRRGLTVDGEAFQPMQVAIDRQQGANAWLTVSLREGRNREIRRAMESVGLVVNRLIRVSYGPFRLGDLAPGAVEEVKARVVRDQLGLAGANLAEPQAQGDADRRDDPAPGKPRATSGPRAARPAATPGGGRRPARPKAGDGERDETARSGLQAKSPRPRGKSGATPGGGGRAERPEAGPGGTTGGGPRPKPQRHRAAKPVAGQGGKAGRVRADAAKPAGPDGGGRRSERPAPGAAGPDKPSAGGGRRRPAPGKAAPPRRPRRG